MTNSAGRSHRYRKGVGAVLFNSDGMVFVARRIDTPFEAWQLPQGGVDRQEKPRHAVFRELKEEIGTDKAEVLAKSSRWLSYDLPDDIAKKVWRGKYGGQKQRWFALKFTGNASDIDLAASNHPEFDAWKWISIEDLPDLAIWFKRSLYEDIVSEFRHLTQVVSGKAT